MFDVETHFHVSRCSRNSFGADVACMYNGDALTIGERAFDFGVYTSLEPLVCRRLAQDL